MLGRPTRRKIPIMLRPIGWSALVLLLSVAGARAEETLQAPGLRERVKVERTQFEVIVWPAKDDVAACRSLTKHDFELSLARRPFTDFELDPLEIPPDATVQGSSEAPATAAAPSATPNRLVALLFDWWGLGQQGTDEYSPRARAFTQARAFIETHPSDRFVILELGDEATFHSTTFQPGSEALATLDRFETGTDATGFLIRGQHLDMRGWRDAILETVARLGAMEPRETKDLFVMTTDVFPDSDVFHDDLRKLTTENKVRVHSLDLAWDLRVLPYGLFAFSEAGGGVVFTDSATLTSAIQTLDRLRPCTYRITLNVPDSKRALPLSVTMKNPRFRVTAPEAVGGWFDLVAAEHAELKNDFEDPTTEVGRADHAPAGPAVARKAVRRVRPHAARREDRRLRRRGRQVASGLRRGLEQAQADGRRCTPTFPPFGSRRKGSARSPDPEARSSASPTP